MTIIKPRRPWRQPSTASSRIGLDLKRLKLNCHSCEKRFNASRPPMDACVFFNRDQSIGVALLCLDCREDYFEMGAYTLPLSAIEDQV